MRAPVAVLAAVLLSGCTTAMELGRARTVEHREWEQGWVIGASGVGHERRVPSESATGGELMILPLPPVEWWGAVGLTRRLELDARLSLLSAQLGAKASVLRSEHVDLAVSGAFTADAIGRWPDDTALRARAAVIAGVPLGPRFELDVAPQLSWALDHPMGEPELAGGTVTLHYGPLPGGMRRIGLAVSVLRYVAPAPKPHEVAEGQYVGVGIVMSTGGSAR